MKHLLSSSLGLLSLLSLSCGGGGDHGHEHGPGGEHEPEDARGQEEVEPEASGEAHEEEHEDAGGGGHHDEVSLGSVLLGEHEVALAQGHGAVAAGKEMHLVVKLPYSDEGQTVVRAWLGTEDRTLSRVARGEYAASHDDYDAHVMAPDPLPEGTQWWVEIEQPDGTRLVGSADPNF